LQWLAIVSLAVLYNIIFVVGRAVFWEINKSAPAVWYTLDYLCDFIYLLDTLVHMHEGEPHPDLLYFSPRPCPSALSHCPMWVSDLRFTYANETRTKPPSDNGKRWLTTKPFGTQANPISAPESTYPHIHISTHMRMRMRVL